MSDTTDELAEKIEDAAEEVIKEFQNRKGFRQVLDTMTFLDIVELRDRIEDIMVRRFL